MGLDSFEASPGDVFGRFGGVEKSRGPIGPIAYSL